MVWFRPALMMMNILFRVIRAVIFFMYEINGYSAIISKDPVSTSLNILQFDRFLCCVNMS